MKRGKLIVFENGLLIGEYEIREGQTLIGRGPTVDVQVTHDGISREHALLSLSEGEYLIEDLQSTNGLAVNGTRVGSATLEDGDKIQIGRAVLEFHLS